MRGRPTVPELQVLGEQLMMELRRLVPFEGSWERPAVHRLEGHGKLSHAVSPPKRRPSYRDGRTARTPARALGGCKLRVNRGTRRRRGAQDSRQVLQHGDDDDIVVHGPSNRRGVGGGHAQHGKVHCRDVEERAEGVPLLEPPLYRQPAT